MKREIKFRAWFKGCSFPFEPTDLEDYEKPQMIYNVQNLYDGRGCDDKFGTLGGRSSFGSLLDDGSFDIMQFTGIKDESGNNIYEGDILTGGFVVTYNDGSDNANHGMSIGFFQQRNNFESWTELIAGESYVVIGNIHESPELLNTNP